MKVYLEIIAPYVPAGMDPRHVMGYILTGRSGLSNMSREEFKAESAIGVGCVNAVGTKRAEECAKSWGL